jgi:iron-sulfur cluster assembly accessory protein
MTMSNPNAVSITENSIQRIKQIRQEKANPRLCLRIRIEGGGCSGFQYIFSWDENITSEDKLYADTVIIDDLSLPLIEGSTIDYVVSLMGEDFKITNPNAQSGCGCGTSFSIG